MPIYKGNTKVVKLYKGSTQIVKRYKGNDLIYNASRLPAEFQEVEYLESQSSGPYINTGYVCLSNNQKIILDFENIYNYGNGVFGSQSSSARSGILWKVGNNIQFGIGNQSAGTIIGSFNLNIKYRFEYESTSNTYSCKLDNTYLKENASYQGSNITNLPIFLFASNYQGSPENPAAVRIYSCQIYDNNILVRNFVPCYRKADNVAGLYDLVNGVFYTNAGSSSFVIGGNI